MIIKYIEAIKNESNIRSQLIELRKFIKNEWNKRELAYELEGEYKIFVDLLQHEDAKIRKNAVLILGELEDDALVDVIFEAYEKEETLFVKSDYLKALKLYDFSMYKEQLKARLKYLLENDALENEQKHKKEEIRLLSSLLLSIEKPEKHKFTGFKCSNDIILVTNKNHQQVTLDQIKSGKAKIFNAGVIVRTEELKEILGIRTYSAILFKLPKVGIVSKDPKVAAQQLVDGGLLQFLKERHDGSVPFYFRIELKTKQLLDQKSQFAKTLGSEIERLTSRQLVNDTSHYEIELRLIENKDEEWNVLIKLYTIDDNRFDYRKNTVAASIAPQTAALIAQLAKPYMKEEASVLDPFCGVGTMLIERNEVMHTENRYGVDIYGEAIEGAIENMNRKNLFANLVTRDFFEFQHKYLFDEIFTNMPTVMGRKTQQEIDMLYEAFFEKAHTMLVPKGIIVMYTRDLKLVEKYVDEFQYYTIQEKICISAREDAFVCILKIK
ncbi:MAG: methyltransferase [Cellulosilyticaceae bacterium]